MAPSRNWLAAAGVVYVVAWLIGLVIAPSAPAHVAELAGFYRANRVAVLAQIGLVHGVAAFALLGVSLAIRGALSKTAGTSARVINLGFGAAIVAVSLSLAQTGLGVALVSSAGSDDIGLIATLRSAIDIADAFKLSALAIMAATSIPPALRRQALPRWIGWLGLLLAPALGAGGLSFVIASQILTGALYVSLPLLLVWVGGISVALLRSRSMPATGGRSVLAR